MDAEKSVNDSQLVESLIQGNASAFDRLFGKYASRLYAFGLKYLRTREDAEGLVQGVFLKVWENRDKLKKDTSFQSYLFTIAYHDICNIFRKRLNQRLISEKLIRENPEPLINPVEGADYRSVIEQVDRLISLLPERQRTVFLKSRKQGLSTKEIAEELALSPGTVDNYISSSLKFIRAKLADESLPVILYFSLSFCC